LITLTDNLRESTAIENKLLAQNKYTFAADPAKTFIASKAEEEFPYIDFSPLQNALVSLEKSNDSLSDLIKKSDSTKSNYEGLNKKLYQSEQQLLLQNVVYGEETGISMLFMLPVFTPVKHYPEFAKQ
jgi:N-acetylated-alpha-linked acidic dipeptidase